MGSAAMSQSRPPVRRAWIVAAVALLLALHAFLAIQGVLNRSVTSDETAHLTAGYTYWKFGDYRLQPENGNLPQRWGALPLLLANPYLDPADDPIEWRISSVWNIAQRFLFERGNNTDYLLLSARATMLAWSLAAGLLVFGWARALGGNAAGLGALALFAVSPTTLAHGPLVTSDMCAAVCLLAATGAGWRFCLQPGAVRALVFGLTTGLAFVAKFSAVLLLPVLALILVATLIGRRGLAINQPAIRPFVRVAVGGAMATVIVFGVIWLSFGFRYAAPSLANAPFDHFYLPFETLMAGEQMWVQLVQVARTVHLLPEAFLYGFSFVAYFSAQRGAFLVGDYSSTGWWWFFPFAFLVKSTLGELLVSALLVIRGWTAWPRGRSINWAAVIRSPLFPLVCFTLVYGSFSLTTKLNIGQRHILPLYLVLFITAGLLFSVRSIRLLRIMGVLGILLSAGETLSNHPHHLAFFNRAAGGPENGWRLLVDSSLDWGQDVAALGQWVQKNRRPGEPVYVSSFGTADPLYEGTGGVMLAPYYSLGKPREWFDLQPGLYCVSATMLQDVYGIRPGPWTSEMERDFQYLGAAAQINAANGTWDRKIPETGFHPEHPLWLLDRLRFARLCQYLKVRKPDAVINHTQFVYRLTPAEVETVMDRPFSALAKLMEQAAAAAP